MVSFGISDYSSYLQNYRIPDISEVKPVLQLQQEQLQQQPVDLNEKTVIAEQEPVRNPVGRNADLENISLKFNTGEDYGYIGKDSDLAQLDMQKAISDMQKDSILQQYQYFVGSSQNLVTDKIFDEGIVVPKFDM